MTPFLTETKNSLLLRLENGTFSECYDLEMELTKETFAQKEYIEGIRSFFIEKDFKPKWKH